MPSQTTQIDYVCTECKMPVRHVKLTKMIFFQLTKNFSLHQVGVA